MEQSYKAEPYYYSNRLKRKLDELRFVPAAVVEAPSGYGKTTAIKDYFVNRLPQGTPVYWFTAVDETPASAFRRLSRQIEEIDRNAGQRLLKIEFPNSAAIGEATEALRSIKCMHEVYLVIDNFQLLYDIFPSILFNALFEHGGERLHIIFVTQIIRRDLLAVVMSHRCLHIKTVDLRLSAEDIHSYYSLAGVRITKEEAQTIAYYTEGWIIAVYLQLRAIRETGRLSDTVGIFALMEHLIWQALTEEQKTFLLYLSPFETVTIQQACEVIGSSTLPDYALDVLESPFIRYEEVQEQYEVHAILADLLIQKRRERGAAFEQECLLRAGDYCRQNGKIAKAMGFYVEIKDYDRMLSLDFSPIILETIGDKPFGELAQHIAQNCPADIKRRHLLPLLRVAWALCMAGMKETYEMLLEELYTLSELHKDSKLLAEWLLLSSYRSFPHIKAMTAILRKAAPIFDGKCSQVILPTMPWCFGNHSPMGEFHTESGRAEEEASELEEYIAIYSRLTNGHGSGADVLFRAELAYHCGDIGDAEILAYKAIFLAESNKQNVVQLGATLYLAHIALNKMDIQGWERAINSMERTASFPSQDNFVSRNLVDIVRGVLLNELEDQTNIAEWLKTSDYCNHRLLKSMTLNAVFVHLSYLMHQGEYARVIGIGQIFLERGSWSHPMREAFLILIMAVGYHVTGKKSEAAELLECAGQLLLPDGMIFPLAAYSFLLGEMVDKMIEQKYPQHFERFQDVKKRFGIGWSSLREVVCLGELPADLTPREYEVAMLAAEGLRNSEIAQKLAVTESTVRAHLRVVFQKLQIDRRAKLADKLK